MSYADGTKCCAKCGTPYGHSAEAGRCCHPVLVSAYRTQADVEAARAGVEEAAPEPSGSDR